ncbi:MAG: D-tyrosyl-tRNA(Tyr) deacylase [Ignavibacteriae bacterium HGW-Ignavibacteriae-4]|nr:MAG: D-tyrosyl-tRNA(Tyr) deacylase [Ignavibacteriae bacterium HGW-Ignavibacteriae-4]
MKLIIQRVSEASVKVDERIVGRINNGLLVLLGVKELDTEVEINWLVNKLLNLRIFNDSENKMNLSVTDISGDILVVPNFTLYADCKKGYRPSFINAAKPDISEPLFDNFVKKLKTESNLKIETGIFGADMKVSLVNDGPVTIEIEK